MLSFFNTKLESLIVDVIFLHLGRMGDICSFDGERKLVDIRIRSGLFLFILSFVFVSLRNFRYLWPRSGSSRKKSYGIYTSRIFQIVV